MEDEGTRYDNNTVMPRNPYQYNDTTVKLPGHIVAMATLCYALLLPGENRNATSAEKTKKYM